MHPAWRTILDHPAAGALCWLASLQIVPVELAVAFAWRRPYDFATNFISVLLWFGWHRRKAAACGLVLLCAAGACAIVIGMVATVLYASGSHGSLGSGVVERLAVDPAALWLGIVGVWLLREHLIRPLRRRRRLPAGAA